MKKFVSLVLALLLVMSLSAAFAEERQYVVVSVADADGNEYDIVNNPDMFPVLVAYLDDANMICAFGTEDEVIAGTIESIEMSEEEGIAALYCVLEDGTELCLIYDGVNDTLVYVDEEGYVYGFANVEVLAEAAA